MAKSSCFEIFFSLLIADFLTSGSFKKFSILLNETNISKIAFIKLGNALIGIINLEKIDKPTRITEILKLSLNDIYVPIIIIGIIIGQNQFIIFIKFFK